MQWLTAILAFATTMLIFAIIVSTIVETIHRALGSRTIALEKLIVHFYDQVMDGYIKDEDDATSKAKFLETMTLVRAPAAPGVGDKATNGVGQFGSIPSSTDNSEMNLAANKANTGQKFSSLTRWSLKLLSDLPVTTFMERLGGSVFGEKIVEAANTKGKNPKEKANNKDLILKDIAQKFELIGQESSIYFGRKARSWSVAIAFFVAWTFYVQPQNLMQTYLDNPETAAKIAEMNTDSLERFKIQKESLEALQAAQNAAEEAQKTEFSNDDLEKLLADVEKDIAAGKQQAKLLVDAGAPIGWPEGSVPSCIQLKASWLFLAWPNSELTEVAGKETYTCPGSLSLKTPFYFTSWANAFWLLMGGLLIGLGAPFWAKAVGQLAQARNATQNLTSILKPQMDPNVKNTSLIIESNDEDKKPITTKAFEAAEAARNMGGN